MFTSCCSQEVTLTWMQCGLLCGKGFQKDVTACVPLGPRYMAPLSQGGGSKRLHFSYLRLKF